MIAPLANSKTGGEGGAIKETDAGKTTKGDSAKTTRVYGWGKENTRSDRKAQNLRKIRVIPDSKFKPA